MAVAIASDLIDQIVAAAERSPAAEVCGLLLSARHAGAVPASADVSARPTEGTQPGGDRDDPGSTIEHVVHCLNVAPDPRWWFEIDPVALLAAHRSARAGGPAVIGHYHSHPTGDPTPSPRDAADAAPDGSIWLIVARGEVRAFRAVPGGILHGRFDPVALRVTR